MRLFEVEDRFADDLETALRNLVGRSNQKHASLKLTYQALSNILKNMGYGDIDHQEFKKVFDSNQSIQNIVRDFDKDSVMISTEVEQDDDEIEKDESEPRSQSVDQMASQGSNAFLNNPLN
jgi:hypothetical protein